MSIQFTCDCGEPLAARLEHAGRAVRCTACNAVVLVPSPDDYSEEVEGARPAAIQSERPAPRTPWAREPSRPTRDFDEDSDGLRPKRVRKSGGGGILLLGALIVLLAGGGVVYYLFVHGKGPSPDFDLVPRDAQAFVTFRVADAMKSDLGKKGWNALKAAGDGKLKELEEKSGLSPEDIDRMTAVVVDGEHQVFWFVVKTNKPCDRARILAGMGKTVERTHQGKSYQYAESNDMGVTFVSDQLLVFGTDPGMKSFLEQPSKPRDGDLEEPIRMASKPNAHFSGGFNMKALASVIARQRGEAALIGINELKSFWMSSSLADTVELEMGFETVSRSRAKQAVADMEAGLVQARMMLPMLKNNVRENVGNMTPDDMVRVAGKVLDTLKVNRDGSSVVLTMALDSKELTKAFEGFAGAVDKVRDAATKASSQNNFKQINLAMMNYADQQNGQMPARMLLEPKTDRPLKLSWRVAILPQLDQEPLYRQIRLNEPWDSVHNKQFWNKMPKVFEMPGLPAEKGMTAIQVFTGPNTLFQGNVRPRFPADFLDGTSNTILIAEAAQAVNWMKPDDISNINANDIRASLGSRTGNGPLVGMADGRVLNVPPTVTNATLKMAMDPKDGMLLGPDWPQ